MTDIEQKENTSSSIETKIKMMYAVLCLFMGIFCLLVFVTATYIALSSRLLNSGGILQALDMPFHFGFLISSVFFTLTAFLLWNKPNKINRLKIVTKYPKTFMLFWISLFLVIIYLSTPVETCGSSEAMDNPCSPSPIGASYY